MSIKLGQIKILWTCNNKNFNGNNIGYVWIFSQFQTLGSIEIFEGICVPP